MRDTHLTPKGQQGGPDGSVGCLWELSSSLVIWNCVSLRADLRAVQPLRLACLISGLRAKCMSVAIPPPSQGAPITSHAWLGPGGPDK